MINDKIKKRTQNLFIIMACLFFLILPLSAIQNYLSVRKIENIKLGTSKLPLFTVKTLERSDAHKELIWNDFPLFDPQNQTHIKEIDHEAILDTQGYPINVPLFVKLTTQWEANFPNVDNYFTKEVKVNNVVYSDDARPRMTIDRHGKGTLKFTLRIQEHTLLQIEKPVLQVILDYEIVNEQGQSFSGGAETLKAAITEKA